MPVGPLLGPFRCEEELGRGGMGVVWRARLPDRSLQVAVKALLAATSAHARASFLDEVRAAAGLDHPNVALVFDYGVSPLQGADCPWLAMELASGGTLAARARALDWERLREAVVAVLDGLAHAHARGLVHLDVKAENCLLGTAADARSGWMLVDFGIAMALGRGGDDGRVAGTPSHMPPEQWRGQSRDYGPWTDLYAVGCMVWGLATGATPYLGTIPELQAAHREGRLPPFRPLRPVPAGLEGWLRTALAPEPGRRFRCAADAARALLAVGEAVAVERRSERPVAASGAVPTGLPGASYRRSSAATEPEPTRDLSSAHDTFDLGDGDAAPSEPQPPEGEAPRVDGELPALWGRRTRRASASVRGLGLGVVGLRTPALAGRAHEQAALDEALAEVEADGLPRAVVLRGASGRGKTRLARALLESALERGRADGFVAPHYPVPDVRHGAVAALRAWLGLDGLDPVEARARLRRVLARAGAPEVDTLARVVAPVADPGANGDPKLAASALIGACASARPVIVVLDDAQWEVGAIALCEAILARPVPVLVVLTAQEEALHELPDAEAALRRLRQRPRTSSLDLGPLPDRDLRAVVEDLLPLAPATLADLVARASGNPMFAVQQLVAWAEQGALEARADGFAARAIGRSDALDHLWDARVDALLGALDPDDAQALEIAAALGMHVSDDEWRAIAAPSSAVEQAVLRHRLGFRSPREEGWTFAHPLARATIEARARAAGRWIGHHQRCVVALAAKGAPPHRLGHHLLEAGELERGLAELLVAARRSQESGRPLEAAAHLARAQQAGQALGLPEGDARLLTAAALEARVLFGTRGAAIAVPIAERALTLARAAGLSEPASDAARVLATLWRIDRPAEAVAVCRDVLAAFGSALPDAQRALLTCSLGLALLHSKGGAAEGDAILDGVLAGPERAFLAPAQVGDVLRQRAVYATGDRSVQEALLVEAMACYDEAGSVPGRAAVLHDLGNLASNHGEDVLARERFTAARLCFDALANTSNAAVSRISGAVSALRARDWAEARELLAEVRALGRAGDIDTFDAIALFMVLPCDAAARDWDAYEQRLDEAWARRASAGRLPVYPREGLAIAEALCREAGELGLAARTRALEAALPEKRG